MAETPGYRSSRRTLEKLAASYILFEGPGAEPGAWDAFRVRNLGLAAVRHPAADPSASGLAQIVSPIPDLRDWPSHDKAALTDILAAKRGPSEVRYLRLMQRHPRLRAAFLALSR